MLRLEWKKAFFELKPTALEVHSGSGSRYGGYAQPAMGGFSGFSGYGMSAPIAQPGSFVAPTMGAPMAAPMAAPMMSAPMMSAPMPAPMAAPMPMQAPMMSAPMPMPAPMPTPMAAPMPLSTQAPMSYAAPVRSMLRCLNSSIEWGDESMPRSKRWLNSRFVI